MRETQRCLVYDPKTGELFDRALSTRDTLAMPHGMYFCWEGMWYRMGHFVGKHGHFIGEPTPLRVSPRDLPAHLKTIALLQGITL